MATSADASPKPPGSTVASSPPFPTYRDYINHLMTSKERKYKYNNLAELLGVDTEYFRASFREEDLWLLRFQVDGNPALSYRYIGHTGSSDIVTAAGPGYEVVTSSNGFLDRIVTFDEKAEYQVIIWQLMNDRTPGPHIINVLGMGLDMEPDVLEHICSRPGLEVPWMNKDKFMEIGKNSMVVLEGLPTKRLKTAIVFLQQSFRFGDDDVQFPILYPPKRPSHGTSPIPEDTLQRARWEGKETWALRRYILAAGEDMESFGAGNFLFACLDGLLRLQLAIPPKNVPNFDTPDEGLDLDIWTRLRSELDAQKLALMRLPDFVRLNFTLGQGPLEKTFKKLERMYEIYIKELEVGEAQLRDNIGILTSQKSTEMAKKSIEESKRVILLTWVALIFIPLSFASSIYGMNVQQINETGHSIGAFVITAITLLATTFFIWGGVAGIAAYRNRRIARGKAKDRDKIQWIDKLLFVEYNVFKEVWWHLYTLRRLRYLRKKARRGNV